ncbi:hypothetical protein L9F63_002555, partial [Diploptera punctata]
LKLKNNETKVSFGSKRSRGRFCVLVHTLNIMHRLMITRNVCTRRELYYQNPQLFNSQSVLDAAIRDICSLLDAPSWQLGVMATSKGLISGPAVLFLESGENIDCNNPGGVLIPQDIHLLERVESPARFILVLEKDATFQKLLDENVLERLGPCLLVTGKGYPDVCTRVLVHRLWKYLKVPVFALVDADPHGVEILCVYRFGSLAMSHQAELSVPAIRWIGIHPSDISQLALQAQPLVDTDVNKLRHLAARPYIRSNPVLHNQVQILLTGGRKAEIEGVARFSSCYLTDAYLPTKILNCDIL